MDNSTKAQVQAAVDDVGPAMTRDASELLKEMDKLIEVIQGLKERITIGKSGPLGMKMEWFRDIQSSFNFGDGYPTGFDQLGPSVLKITILDYKNAGKVLTPEK